MKEIDTSNGVQIYETSAGIVTTVNKSKLYRVSTDSQEIHLTANVKEIDSHTFIYANEVKKFYVAPKSPYFTERDGVLFTKDLKELVAYPAKKADQTYQVPDNTKIIRANAFYDNVYLENISIPSSVEEIGTGAFSHSCIQSATIESTASIPEYCFAECWSLNNVVLADGIDKIELNAFASCHNIKHITIPSSVTSIGVGAFQNCANLESIDLNARLRIIDDSLFENCNNLKSITIPKSVYSILPFSFYRCASLEEITLYNSLNEIRKHAFGYNKNLKKIRINEITPNSIDIHPQAFCEEDTWNSFFNVEEVIFVNNKGEERIYSVQDFGTLENLL